MVKLTRSESSFPRSRSTEVLLESMLGWKMSLSELPRRVEEKGRRGGSRSRVERERIMLTFVWPRCPFFIHSFIHDLSTQICLMYLGP
jgi:hypothetical protein